MNNLNATGSACVTTELKAPDMSVEERGEGKIEKKRGIFESCGISERLSGIPVIGFVCGNGMMTNGQFIISLATIVVMSLFFCSSFICVFMKEQV